MINSIIHICTRYMAIGVVLAGIFGIYFPNTMKPLAPYIPIMLGFIMFGMGMSLTLKDFQNILKQPKNIALGSLLQFMIMPSLAFLLIKLFPLPSDIAIGVVLVGCCPGGTASNVISYIAHADVPLSVSMTMINTILAPFLTPFLIWLIAGTWIHISLSSMMISIIKIVLLPLLVGIGFNYFFPKQMAKAITIMPMFSALVIILTVSCVVSLSGHIILENGLTILIVVILHNLGGILLGLFCTKKLGLSKSQVRAMTIEVSMQNSGLASTLALMYFTGPGGIAGAIFSVWHNISGSLFASYCLQQDEERSQISSFLQIKKL